MRLNSMFIDMNAYFASVEQQLRPELRGLPVGIVPVLAETTCCIACSYEAKRLGIKTGTPVYEARRICPELRIVEARPALYVKMHHRFVDAIESILHVDEVRSIDEVSCQLMAGEREPEQARRKAMEVKEAIRLRCGRQMTCSIGIAPNRLLAKLGSDMQKPDGLTILEPKDLPHRLFSLELTDLPGIGAGMYHRLRFHGVTTIQQLYERSEEELKNLWGSVVGRRWWYWLRGHELPEEPTRTASIGHSHVLPPKYRDDAGAHAVLVRLLHKAAARMRSKGYWARRLRVGVAYAPRGRWGDYRNLEVCQDTITLMEALEKIWAGRPGGKPSKVGVVLERVVADPYATQPLFEAERQRLRLSRIIDDLNARFGENAVYLGSMHDSRESAPLRISFTVVPELPDPDTVKADGKIRRWKTGR